MRPDVQKDFDRQARYMPAMKRIVGEYLIGEAPDVEDREHNTDLIVLRLETVRIACRVRRFQYLTRYGHEFTIRCSRPNGAKTELTKIIEGWGDYILYGFESQSGESLAAWMLGDLKVFRLWFNRRLASNGGRTPGALQPNHDRSSQFRAFRITDLPDDFLIARKANKAAA